jgi:hypothetical protein
MPALIAVVAEGREDAEVCVGLTRRIVMASPSTPDWIRDDPAQLEEELRFAGLEPDTAFTQRRRIKAIAELRALPHRRSIQRLRKFGTPIGEDFADTWKVIALATADDRKFDAVIVSRDTDGNLDRWESWRTVKESSEGEPLVILAAQHCMLEAWLLNGFVPHNDAEHERLEGQTRALGFNPVKKAALLTAKPQNAKKSAKRVLKELTSDNVERRRMCWEGTELKTLRENGKETGLSEFLNDLESGVIPLVAR